MKLKTVLFTLLVGLSLPAFSQDMAQPLPEEMKMLDSIVGHWEGTLKMPMGPGQEMSMKGTIDIDKVLGGRYVREMHKYSGEGMPEMTGMLLMTYDASSKNWMSWWYDSSAPGVMEMSGKQDGKSVVMISKPTTMAGQENVIVRSTWTHESEKKVSMKLEMKEGDKWSVFMSGEYEKKN